MTYYKKPKPKQTWWLVAEWCGIGTNFHMQRACPKLFVHTRNYYEFQRQEALSCPWSWPTRSTLSDTSSLVTVALVSRSCTRFQIQVFHVWKRLVFRQWDRLCGWISNQTEHWIFFLFFEFVNYPGAYLEPTMVLLDQQQSIFADDPPQNH